MSDQKNFGIAVIGSGPRGRGVVANLLDTAQEQVKVISLYDLDPLQTSLSIKRWRSPDVKICVCADEAINCPGVDWVMIATPNAWHKEYIMASFAAGKNVFCEKPLATSVEDCLEICNAQRASGLTLMTGFVLRYSALYRKIKALLDSGRMGKILNISASENRETFRGGNSMQNWRRFTSIGGPYMLEKCCHDLDILNWLTDSLPSRVAGFGGLDLFTPENEHLWEKYGKKYFANEARTPADKIMSPFTSEKDIKDNHAAIIEYRNGIKVLFQLTLANAIPERRMYISCSEGTIIGELFSGELKYKCIDDEAVSVVSVSADEHGGGDKVMVSELYECMLEGGRQPKTGGSEGMECAVTALAIDEAMNTGKVIDIEPIWKQLGR